MKLRSLLLTGLAGIALSLSAQTHVEGIEYFKAEQYNNAYELLKRNFNNPGTDKSLSDYYLGQIELMSQDPDKFEKASKIFNEGITANPNNPYNYVGLGYIALIKDKDLKAAEKYFKDAEGKDKKDYTLQMEIARAYYNADPVGYKEKYEKKIENAIKKDKTNPDIYILQGDILRDEAYQTEESKTYGSAAAKYDMATSNDPTSAVAYVKYADMYSNVKNYDYAIKKLQELLQNNPTSALGQRQLAELYYDTQKYDLAADQYGKYVNNPSHFKSDENRYLLILFGDQKYQDGYNYATKLLQENPDNFTAQSYQFINAAQIPEMADQLLPLGEKLLATKRANPSYQLAQIHYMLIPDELAKAGRTDEAIALIQEGISEQPNNPAMNQALTSVYMKMQEYGQAADAFQGYLDKTANPKETDYATAALYNYYGGMQYNSLNQPDKANEYFTKGKALAQKAADANPTWYKSYKIMGDIASAANPNDQATAAAPSYIKAIELYEAQPEESYKNDAKNMYYTVAFYYNQKGDKAAARNAINKALEIDPNNENFLKLSNAIK